MYYAIFMYMYSSATVQLLVSEYGIRDIRGEVQVYDVTVTKCLRLLRLTA